MDLNNKKKKGPIKGKEKDKVVSKNGIDGDERFSGVGSNPIFRSVPKKEGKVGIDARFQSMFHDKSFKLKYKVDKRGKPVRTSTDASLKRYYNLEDEEGVKSESDDDEDTKVGGVPQEKPFTSKTKLSKELKKKLHSDTIDYARGEGLLLSESDSSKNDEDSSVSGDSDAEGEEEDLDHEWGELDAAAERTEDSTYRLALCNMDWDRVQSSDLMVLFASFLPPGGILKRASIYPSEFGKSRMEVEELKGPLELQDIKEEVHSSDEEEESQQDPEDEDVEEGSEFTREKLRKYQLNRLKYFYAVLEFDSVDTADKVYKECDGLEYESSSAKIDLRFIPDEMVFDETPVTTCDVVPEASKYTPKYFTTTALQQIKVECTWDETDPNRKDIISKAMDATAKDKISEDDLRAYLASDSSGSDNDNDVQQEEDEKDGPEESNPISKYRALLESIEKKEGEKKSKDVELEITWGVGLKEKAVDLVKKKSKAEELKKMTPWEEQLLKQKEKRRKQKKKGAAEEGKTSHHSDSSDGGSDDEESPAKVAEAEQPFSDDDVDVDMSDPFFKDELANLNGKGKWKKKESSPKKLKGILEGKEDKHRNGELDLLLFDESDTKAHFNFKKIIADDSESKSKRKRRLKLKKKKPNLQLGEKAGDGDDFAVDAQDTRFSALFTSHHFNIDPSEPSFKRTKGMESLIAEKQKRSKEHPYADVVDVDTKNGSPSELPFISKSNLKKINNPELNSLVSSVKSKTQSAGFTKKKGNPRKK